MKILFLAVFFVFLAVSLAKPQVSFGKNGRGKHHATTAAPDELYDFTDVVEETGPGKFYVAKNGGDDDGTGYQKLKKGGEDDGGYGEGEGGPGKLYRAKKDDGQEKKGDPQSRDGDEGEEEGSDKKEKKGNPLKREHGDEGEGSGNQDGSSDHPDEEKKGNPLSKHGDGGEGSGGQKLLKKSDGDDGGYGEGGPPKHNKIFRKAASVAHYHKNGKSVFRASRNGPHRVIATKWFTFLFDFLCLYFCSNCNKFFQSERWSWYYLNDNSGMPKAEKKTQKFSEFMCLLWMKTHRINWISEVL